MDKLHLLLADLLSKLRRFLHHQSLQFMSSGSSAFRNDIQGLRAIAVLAVVIFHIRPASLSGGYIGVDVFFVISGFLIIGHIWKDIHQSRFSLLSFYARRIKRLFPTLFVTLLASGIGAYLFMLPAETTDFSQSAIATLFYVSNFFFYTQLDYFNDNAALSPLLHTWSLAVEEQFYLICPFVLLLIAKLAAKNLVPILLILALLSLILSQYLLSINPSLAFYISPTRFWQFFAGGLIAVMPINNTFSAKVNDGVSVVSLLILAACFALYDQSTAFPGTNAIPPTAATAALLYFACDSHYAKSFLSSRFMLFFGNISYALYLVHWPIIVFYLAMGLSPTGSQRFTVFFISVALAYVLTRFIEAPCKNAKIWNTNKRTFIISTTLSGVVVGVALYANDGLPARFTQQQLLMSQYLQYDVEHFRNRGCFISSGGNDLDQLNKDECIIPEKGKYNRLLIGDSHAAHWYSALKQTLPEDHTLSQATKSRCRPDIFIHEGPRCATFYRWVLGDLVQGNRFDEIIISGLWKEEDAIPLKNTIAHLSAYTKKIIVLGPTVKYAANLPRILANHSSPKIIAQYRLLAEILHTEELIEEASIQAGAQYISVLKATCPAAEVSCKVMASDEVPMVFDKHHLTQEGALLLVKQFKSQGLL